MSNNKKEFGQFFTTNPDYIIGELYKIIPKDATVVDPFAGNGDLLKFIKKKYRNITTEAYDIDPKTKSKAIEQDSLLTPLNLKGKWVITNPPYLAMNKTQIKETFVKYDADDLYKCSLKMISGFAGNTPCEGGVIIIPVNFFSCRDDSIRRWFLSRYKVKALHIFEERVFEDTDYTVCAFSFVRQKNCRQDIKPIKFFPKLENSPKTVFKLHKKEGYRVGVDVYNTVNKHKKDKSRIRVERLVKDKPITEGYSITRLYLKTTDTGSEDGRMRLEIRDVPFYGKISDRSFATICTSTHLTWEEEETIVLSFNHRLEAMRRKHNSMFLTNFRNATTAYARKRIDFKLAFDLVEYLMCELEVDKKKG